MTFNAERERNLAFTVELEAARVERALQHHVAEHRAQAVVAQPVSLQRPGAGVAESGGAIVSAMQYHARPMQTLRPTPDFLGRFFDLVHSNFIRSLEL